MNVSPFLKIYFNFCFHFLRQSFALSPRLESSGVLSSHWNLCLLGSRHFAASDSSVAEITGMCHHAWLLIFVFFGRDAISPVVQAGLQLLASTNLPTSPSQSAGITGSCHHAWLVFLFLVETRFHHVGQAGLEFLTSGDLPASASQSAGITGVSHYARPYN